MEIMAGHKTNARGENNDENKTSVGNIAVVSACWGCMVC